MYWKRIITAFDNPWGDEPQNSGNNPKANKPKAAKPAANNQINIEEIFKKYKDRVNGSGGGDNQNPQFPSFGSLKNSLVIFLAVILFWLFSGIYTVQPDEQALVLRFGKYHRTAGPGLHYHLPAPVEKKIKVKVTKINSEEIGYRSAANSSVSKTEESLMLTGDENIVDIHFEVQWRIGDAYDFVFNVRNVREGDTVKSAAESAMREVIGRTKIALALAEGRDSIEEETKDLLQKILDSYQAGVEIVRLQLLQVDPPAQVIDAFRDVQTAKLDKEKTINQAESYRNDVIPRARGEAQKILEEALAYQNRVVAEATGQAERFNKIYREYSRAPDVTRKRLYLETMEEIFKNAQLTIVDGKSATNGVVPYLPLKEFNKVGK